MAGSVIPQTDADMAAEAATVFKSLLFVFNITPRAAPPWEKFAAPAKASRF